MKKTLFIVYLFSSINIGCSGQEVHKSKTQNDVQIIDPVESTPFEIIRSSMFVTLPDSLGGKKTTGFSALRLFVNKAGDIDSFRVIKLVTNKDGKPLVDYYQDQQVTAEIKRFEPFFGSYIHDKIKIKRTSKINQNTETPMDIIIRFGDENLKSQK